MASTRQLNDSCYFKTLCAESKAPNNYILNTNVSIHNNKCHPKETPNNTKLNYKNVNIESNLFNISTKQSKCIDGNTLNDKRKGVNNNDLQINDCDNSIHTQYNKSNLNIINRGNDNFNKNNHPFNHPHGNNLDYYNSGNYGFSKCKPFNPEDDHSQCYNGSDLQRLGGFDTMMAAKDDYKNKIDYYSKMNNNNNLYNNKSNNFLEYENTIISNQCQYNCN